MLILLQVLLLGNNEQFSNSMQLTEERWDPSE